MIVFDATPCNTGPVCMYAIHRMYAMYVCYTVCMLCSMDAIYVYVQYVCYVIHSMCAMQHVSTAPVSITPDIRPADGSRLPAGAQLLSHVCTALHYTALHCTALHCTALHFTALHCTILYYTALHCTAPGRAEQSWNLARYSLGKGPGGYFKLTSSNPCSCVVA
jgi:hypothetical protein